PLPHSTGVRDSKAPALGHLEVTPQGWAAFLDSLRPPGRSSTSR
ncbi:MAG: DUF397 domain-containing protein, partial [Streptomycetaceae bacterium]|nr:DUF397 domain-containing protein [Streptomycetaceae bacterium]